MQDAGWMGNHKIIFDIDSSIGHQSQMNHNCDDEYEGRFHSDVLPSVPQRPYYLNEISRKLPQCPENNSLLGIVHFRVWDYRNVKNLIAFNRAKQAQMKKFSAGHTDEPDEYALLFKTLDDRLNTFPWWVPILSKLLK